MVHDASALKYLLPLWMARHLPKLADPNDAMTTTSSKKKSKEHKKRSREWNRQLEETIIRILYALTRFLPRQDDPHDTLPRLVAKFADDSDKCERLVELLLRYDEKARMAEYKYYRYKEDDDDDDNDAPSLEALEAKLAGGGDMFHRLGSIAAFLCVHSKQCHQTILSKLHQQSSGLGLVTDAVKEFLSVLDDANQASTLRQYLEQL